MKKADKILFFFILIIGMYINVSCTKRVEDTNKVKLVFSIWGTPDQVKVEQKIVNEFEKSHPDIDVEIYHIVGMRYDNKLLSMAASGNAPDVMMLEITPFPNYASKGILMDLTPYIKRDKIDVKDIYPLAFKSFQYKGKQYGFPRDISGIVMYYNKDIFDKVGLPYPNKNWTWKDFARVSKKITRDLNGDGIIDLYGALTPPFYMIFWAFGGDIFDNPFNPHKCVVDSKNVIRALKYIRNLLDEKALVPREVVREEGDYQLFMTGKVAMYFNGRWMSPAIKKVKNFKWDVVEVPKGIDGKRYTLQGGTCYGIYSKTKYPEEAWEFLKFYTSKKAVKMAMLGGRTTPIYKSIAESSLFLNLRPPKNMRAFVNTMNYGRRVSYITLNSELKDIIDRNYQLFEMKKLTPEEFVKQLKDEIDNKILKELKNY